MAIPNTFTAGTDAKASEVNENFEYNEQRSPPVGTVMSWLKSYTNTPALTDGWVECNGQTLSDTDSVYNGQVIPDLNGDNRFLRGSSTSGNTGGTEVHGHSYSGTTTVQSSGTSSYDSSSGSYDKVHTHNYSGTTGSVGTLPTYYEVVWIMKVK